MKKQVFKLIGVRYNKAPDKIYTYKVRAETLKEITEKVEEL